MHNQRQAAREKATLIDDKFIYLQISAGVPGGDPRTPLFFVRCAQGETTSRTLTKCCGLLTAVQGEVCRWPLSERLSPARSAGERINVQREDVSEDAVVFSALFKER